MGEDKLKNNENRFLIVDENKYVNEQYIRQMLYQEEIEDLTSNSSDYFKGELNLKYQLESIWDAITIDIKEVVERLEKCWGIPVKIIGGEY